MMEVYREVYKGQIINVSLDERKSGEFTWSYTIDTRHLTRCQDRALNAEEMMRMEALHHAKMRIDGWTTTLDYKGRTVEIATENDEDGQWSWNYIIDIGPSVMGNIIPSRSKATAVAAAKIHAMEAIDSTG